MKVTETSFSFTSEEGLAIKAKIPDTQIHKAEPSESFGPNACDFFVNPSLANIACIYLIFVAK